MNSLLHLIENQLHLSLRHNDRYMRLSFRFDRFYGFGDRDIQDLVHQLQIGIRQEFSRLRERAFTLV